MTDNGGYVEMMMILMFETVHCIALYKPKQPSVTNKIARIGRNTGVANLMMMIII